jgi:hypothetical protein
MFGLSGANNSPTTGDIRLAHRGVGVSTPDSRMTLASHVAN